MDNFINIPFETTNLDSYYIRASIKTAITENLDKFSGKLLDIGCGKMPYKKYILENAEISNYTGLDIEDALVYDAKIQADFLWNGITMPFNDNSFECAIGTEVLEHCHEPKIILKETYRVLKPNGIFFFTVPFLWNLHETPHDYYRYTPYALEKHLKNCGFMEINIQATGGWHASMAQMLGLWVRRSPMTKTKRKLFSKLLKPIIKYLIKKDGNVIFNDGQMITGLKGTAVKK